MEPEQQTVQTDLYTTALILLVFCFMVAGTVFGYAMSFNQAPRDFPLGQTVVVEPGSSMRDITEQLATESVVRSKRFLYLVLVLFHDPSQLKASTYVFDERLSTLQIADLLTTGEFDNDLISVTFREGERAASYARRAENAIPGFSATVFTTLAEPYEGTLWPETYFIPETFTEEELFTLLQNAYLENITPLQAQIAAHPLTENEVITLASIVEREANSPESMRMVAGILQNRLEIGMPLQADATIEYVLDTPLAELPPGQLAIELKELDSPYNSYLNQGLPPTPIGNPGLTAIRAVLEPTPSRYLFYITGDDGEFYYAETLDEHNANIARYLR